MFQDLAAFIDYIESLPPQQLTTEQQQERLVKAKTFIEAQELISQPPIVTITGTNGKGSAVKALTEILVQHDMNVCAFTSPHLIHYTERFAHNQHFIDEASLLRLANKLAALIDLSQWNFFFILFFIFLLWCKELSLDCLILEVGVGGRLDPTNILDASLVILTQVAFDHTELLGDTREAIGFEKAGLLREKIPFICAEPNPPQTVIDQALQLDCISYQLNQQFGFCLQGDEWDVWFQDETFYNLPLPKLHPHSVSAALQAVKILFPTLHLTHTWLQEQLSLINLPARLQYLIDEKTEWVIDVSHNPAAVSDLAQFLQRLPTKHTYAIFGGKITKDIATMIAIMQTVIDEWYLVPVLAEQGLDTHALAKWFTPFAITPHTALDVVDATQKIQAKNLSDRRIVTFGSFRVAGAMLAYLEQFIPAIAIPLHQSY